MPSPVSFTKATLSYPVYSAEFDPYNRGFLMVGGGGGEGRSGVGNKITLLDVTSRASLDVAAEIDLSRDEDSVTTLANLAMQDGLITLAGINSSEIDQKTGRNEHLRTFDVKYPKRKRPTENAEEAEQKSEGSFALLGKASLFRPASGAKPETYQRLLRLSPAHKRPSGGRRIGAIATGLAKSSELIIFDASRTPPGQAEIIHRAALPAEAVDLDVTQSGHDEFSVAWSLDYDVHELTVQYDFETRQAELIPKGPRRIHSMPTVDADGQARKKPKYRSMRFLTPRDILLLSNLPDKKGAELAILHLYPTGPAAVQFHKILPSHIKQAVGLDVGALDPDSEGNQQFAVAVAGQDISIEVYTINYNRSTDTFSPFRNYTTLRDVHPLQMTAICFSRFHSPARAIVPPPPPTDEDQTRRQSPTPPQLIHPGPQYIRLASVSMGNTVVVDTFALSPLKPTKPDSRYVLSHPSDVTWSRNVTVGLISLIVLVCAILVQSYLAPSTSPSAFQLLPPGAREWIAPPQSAASAKISTLQSSAQEVVSSVSSAVPDLPSAIPSSASELNTRLRDMLKMHGSDSQKAIIVRHGSTLRDANSPNTDDNDSEGDDGLATTGTELSTDVVPDREAYLKEDVHARQWHEMEEHEREGWRQKLVRAGEWTVDEGETVLKGLLFSSYAGFVGQAAGDVIREL